MRMPMVALICIHMLLWAGCQATPGLHKLRSNENLLRKAVDSAQPNRGSWRKLLEDDSAKLHTIPNEKETANVTSVATEPKNVDEKITLTTQSAGKADVQLAEKDSTAGDAKIKEDVKADLASPSIARREEGKTASTSARKDAKIEEPKGDVNEGVSREGGPSEQTNSDSVKQNETHTAGTEKVEVLKTKRTMQLQAAPIEEKPTSSTLEGDTTKRIETRRNAQLTQSVHAPKDAETDTNGDATSSEKVPGKKANLVETNNASHVDTKRSDVVLNLATQDMGTPDKLPESGKEDSSPVASAENDKNHSTPQQDEATPDEEKPLEGQQQDGPEKGSTDSGENTDSKEEVAELNSIKMVETSTDIKETDSADADNVVETTETEGVDKEQVGDDDAHASAEKVDLPNNATNGSDEATSDKVEDEKVEDKDKSSANIESKEQNNEDRVEEVAKEQSDEKVEENQQLADDTGDRQNEGNTAEEKAEENQEPSDGTGTKDDAEGEENDAKDIPIVLKSDDETEAATQEVEQQLEALKRDSVIETTVEQTQERDPSEDEYDIIQELVDLPSKFQQTAGKVADHLRPDVIKWTDTSKVYFNLANQQITESFSPLLGKQYAPFFASMISYGVLLLPLIVVIVLFDHIKALFSLQKVLLFINIYLAAYFATLWLASFIIGLEPMSFFYLNSLSNYLSLQLLQAFGYVIYLILQSANAIYACTSDTVMGKFTSALQWVVAMAIGLHYYVTVFHPAIASKPPHTSWKFYAIYSGAFFILCLFARIRWVKKQYVTTGRNVADKKS